MTSEHKKSGLAGLTLAAVGIVYGDIGTSPLYTLKTVFDPEHGLRSRTSNLLGIVSLIFWGLTLIVSLKYVTLVLRADNRGEGGIMALMALALSLRQPPVALAFPADAAGRVRRHHVLRRQRDHAGHFGAVGRSRAWKWPRPA